MSRHHLHHPKLPLQGLTLLVLALLLALAFNALRPAPLPLTQGLAPIRAALAKAQGLLQLSPEEAKALLASGQAQFIDARDPATFKEGAIPGALNFGPGLTDPDLAARATALPTDRPLVVYCDGLGCELSRAMAERLQGLGLTEVRLLSEGLDGWLKAGGPLEFKP